MAAGSENLLQQRAVDEAQALAFFRAHDRYLLVCHAHPDGDTLGSAIGLQVMLAQMGKEARVVCASEIPRRLRFLAGGAAQLAPLPQDLEAYTVVTVDVAAPGLLGDYEQLIGADGAAALALDHHGTHVPFAQRILCRPDLAACAELIFDLAQTAFGYSISSPPPRALAVPLYTGISTDSGSFMYSAVSWKTHQRAAVLLAADLRHYEICAQLYENKPLSEVRATRAAYDQMRLHCSGQVGIAVFTPQVMEQYALSEEDLDSVVNLIRGVEGVRIAVHAKYRAPDTYKISMRSDPGLDVSAVCRQFGGGGHPCAAGCTVSRQAPEEIEQMILQQIKGVLGIA